MVGEGEDVGGTELVRQVQDPHWSPAPGANWLPALPELCSPSHTTRGTRTAPLVTWGVT